MPETLLDRSPAGKPELSPAGDRSGAARLPGRRLPVGGPPPWGPLGWQSETVGAGL